MSQFGLVSQKSRNSDCWYEHEKSQNFRHETEHPPEYGSKTPQNQCDSKYPGSLYWPPHGLQVRNKLIRKLLMRLLSCPPNFGLEQKMAKMTFHHWIFQFDPFLNRLDFQKLFWTQCSIVHSRNYIIPALIFGCKLS